MSLMVTSTSTPGSMLQGTGQAVTGLSAAEAADRQPRAGARDTAGSPGQVLETLLAARVPEALHGACTALDGKGCCRPMGCCTPVVRNCHCCTSVYSAAGGAAVAMQGSRAAISTTTAAAHLMEVICLTTSAGEIRSIRRLWILRQVGPGGAGSALCDSLPAWHGSGGQQCHCHHLVLHRKVCCGVCTISACRAGDSLGCVAAMA
jgi:hypothetical protein